MKNYTILRFSAKHGYDVLNEFQRDFPDWKTLSYTELHAAYRSKRYIYINAFADCMETLGNRAVDIVYDIEFMQKKWAKEHGVPYNDKNWQQDIIFAQIRHYRPDIIYTMEILFLPVDVLKRLKQEFPFLKLLVAQKGFPHAFEELSIADLVYTCTPGIMNQFREKGINANLLYHSFDQTILDALPSSTTNDKRWPCGFVGSSGYGYPNHSFRFSLLTELFEKTELRGWLHELEPPHPVDAPPLAKVYPHRVNEPRFGLEMYKLLMNCGIVLNIHTDAAANYVGNMRLFEATGVGACLLTDSGSNMRDLFDDDTDIVTFSSNGECISKLNELMADKTLCQSIAQNGQKRTLSEHTLLDRCKQIHTELAQLL